MDCSEGCADIGSCIESYARQCGTAGNRVRTSNNPDDMLAERLGPRAMDVLAGQEREVSRKGARVYHKNRCGRGLSSDVRAGTLRRVDCGIKEYGGHDKRAVVAMREQREVARDGRTEV